LGSLYAVKSVALALLLCSASALSAQEQEGKLMNRLLRPSMTLGNSSQNKKFMADKTSVNREARVSTFYLQKKADPASYSSTRQFDTGEYSSRTYQVTNGTSLMAARSTSPMHSYETPSARASVELRDSHNTVSASGFAGNRPFLDKGKSQKALDRKNKPMTIDDIRELLNKNK
jgi:hypothetical protein